MSNAEFSRENITQDFLKSIFNYDAKNGRLIWKYSTRGHRAGEVAGALQKCKKRGEQYRQISIGFGTINVVTVEHRLIFLWHNGYLPEQIDHKNMNKTDNRIENLRPATASTNQMNVIVRSFTKSGKKGVHWDKSRNKWIARIKTNDKAIFLGRFETIEEAQNARKAAQHLHGEYARL